MTRRVVRVLLEIFILLDERLPSERGPAGVPTAAEFAVSDLLAIVEEFAAGWDDLAMSIRGRADYRVLITTTHQVPYVAVRGQLSRSTGRASSSTSTSIYTAWIPFRTTSVRLRGRVPTYRSQGP